MLSVESMSPSHMSVAQRAIERRRDWLSGTRLHLRPEPARSGGASGATLLTTAAIAAALGVSRNRVQHWTRVGRNPAAGVGRCRGALYVLDEVRRALQATGWLGNQKARRRAEADTGQHACSACRRSFPRDHYPPSAGRGMGFLCRDCRRPAKRAADARRRQQKGSTQVEPVSHVLVAERDGWRCAICRGEVTRETWSLDHVVPLSKGGAHTYANVVLAHRSCNVRRGAGRFPVQGPLFATPSGSPCR